MGIEEMLEDSMSRFAWPSNMPQIDHTKALPIDPPKRFSEGVKRGRASRRIQDFPDTDFPADLEGAGYLLGFHHPKATMLHLWGFYAWMKKHPEKQGRWNKPSA